MATVTSRVRDLGQLARARELAASGEAKRLRVAARLSQSEIAAVCEVAPSAVSLWENGKRIPRGRAGRTYAAVIVGLAEAEEARDAPGP